MSVSILVSISTIQPLWEVPVSLLFVIFYYWQRQTDSVGSSAESNGNLTNLVFRKPETFADRWTPPLPPNPPKSTLRSLVWTLLGFEKEQRDWNYYLPSYNHNMLLTNRKINEIKWQHVVANLFLKIHVFVFKTPVKEKTIWVALIIILILLIKLCISCHPLLVFCLTPTFP